MLETLGMLAQRSNTDTILWVIAAILVIAGIVTLIRGSVIAGVVLIVLGLLVGPGGVSLFD
jgi:TM2 domain-containing membrane protein YozV